MKIIVEDFNYKECHFERCVFELPQLENLDESVSDNVIDYINESLNDFIRDTSVEG